MKSLFITTLFALFFFKFPTSSISQTVPAIQLQNVIGGNSLDRLHCLIKTHDGGFVAGGNSYSAISCDVIDSVNGESDFWIIKIDSMGNILWQNMIGGGGDDGLRCIQQTLDGGFILGGFSYSGIGGDKTENCIGDMDYWVIKTDSAGNIQWENTIGGDFYDWLNTIQQSADGGYIIGGYSMSNISGDKTENMIGGAADFWVIKLDTSGNIQWQNTIGASAHEEIKNILQTNDGGYLLAGSSNSNSSFDKTENSYGDRDYWIVKIDSIGNIIWDKTIGGSNLDALKTICQTSDGGFIFGGESTSSNSGLKTENCIGSYDYWIIKTDSLCNIEWQNTIGGNNSDLLQSVQQTSDGGFILGGSSSSNISGDKTENNIVENSTSDYWIVKTSSTGEIQWQSSIGSDGVDFDGHVIQASNNGYIVGGTTDGNLSGDKTDNACGSFDFWIIKLTENYNSINGLLFNDVNLNNLYDAGESMIKHKPVIETTTHQLSFSEWNGDYSFAILDSGNYFVTPPNLDYYNVTPSMHSATFTGILQTDNQNDFAYQPAGVFNDLCITITSQTLFRPGFNASYRIEYSNVGTTTLNPTVIFYPDSNLTYTSASVVASSVTPDSIVWNFPSLAPFQTGSIVVTVTVNSNTSQLTELLSEVIVEPLAGDANDHCNYDSAKDIVRGSFDPNDITVDEDTLFSTQLSNPPYLDYVIRFQNTGNDTAFTVKILNPIDTSKLDLLTLEFVASSHPVELKWISSERNMEFKFENILLADSNINEGASHGFVRYRIKPKTTISVGDSIANYVAIYFDFNAPVITNNAVTHIVLPTSLSNSENTNMDVNLFPNPAGDKITIKTNFIGKTLIRIFDLLGQKIISDNLNLTSKQHLFDISQLNSGIYILEIVSENKTARIKFVKN